MNLQQKTRLLEILATEVAQDTSAENEDKDNLSLFLPLRSYEKIKNPQTFLIVGGRGTGKTKLFDVISTQKGYSTIFGESITIYDPLPERSCFITSFNSSGKLFPDPDVLERYKDDALISSYWAGSICFLILAYFENEDKIRALDIAKNNFSVEIYDKIIDISNLKRPNQWIYLIKDNPEMWVGFLDDIDVYLEKINRWIFMTYDALDKICPAYQDLFPYIRALINFWFTRVRRWNRLKSKIFLRTDLLNSEVLSFPDSSKLNSYRMDLQWNSALLYKMLIKRFANSNEIAYDYLKSISGLISPNKDDTLGYLPSDNETLYESFMECLVGKYMGKDPKKGGSYKWIPNHIQDAKGIVAPRAFIKCFTLSAEAMLNNPKEIDSLDSLRLLSPSRIQGAMEAVSKDRVRELDEEYSWLGKMQTMFKGLSMLVEQSDFVGRIDISRWNREEMKKLPGTTAEHIFDALIDLGIVYIANDGRINVPEIYLHGFGMKRSGGIKRPR